MSITQIAIKRPTMVVVFFTVLAIIGIVTYTKLNYELIPKLITGKSSLGINS